MIARSLTLLSSAMLLLAVHSFAPVMAQEQPSAVPQSPPAAPDAQAQREEREAVEPAVSQPSVADTEAEPSASQPAVITRFRTIDRLELESTAITGNRELPKVLYIVPWKKADLGDLVGRPANSLLDEVLTPVDREVFKRQTEYFSRLDAAPTGSAQQPEQKPAGETTPR